MYWWREPVVQQSQDNTRTEASTTQYRRTPLSRNSSFSCSVVLLKFQSPVPLFLYRGMRSGCPRFDAIVAKSLQLARHRHCPWTAPPVTRSRIASSWPAAPSRQNLNWAGRGGRHWKSGQAGTQHPTASLRTVPLHPSLEGKWQHTSAVVASPFILSPL
jgi:hypothetical protein